MTLGAAAKLQPLRHDAAACVQDDQTAADLGDEGQLAIRRELRLR